ncbi:MAG: type I restriction enzyme HsdR N-terminal domain-containing protein [Rhabdochlamydiaceae bacterium]
MDLSKPSNGKIYDRIRQSWVQKTEEEIVRQNLLAHMIDTLGYPIQLMAVEKELNTLPHLKRFQSFERRLDIVCFAKNIHHEHALYPLLIVECKKGHLDHKAEQQVIGYNQIVKAYFIALANGKEVRLGYPSSADDHYQFISYLPSYEELCRSISK